MAAQQPRPVVRKTKKSSYKPLSKLNEDNLPDLKRSEKPEYTGRVFYYNIASKARLRQNVNVWFRDHKHSLSLLQRQQRAVQQTMCRMQKQVHRAKRDEYKRRQKEIREKLNVLQARLLQRRVVQRFESNAMSRMAARGEQSLTGLRLMGQTRGHSTWHPTDLIVSVSGDNITVNEDDRDPSDPHDNHQDSKGTTVKDQSQSDNKLFTSSNRNAKKNGDSDITCDSNKKHPPHTQTHTKKSMRRFSDSDVRQVQDMDAPDVHTLMTHTPPKSDSGATNLGVIPEDTSPMDAQHPDDSSEENQSDLQEQKDSTKGVAKQNSSSRSSRVLEVRKNRPRSPKTHSVNGARRATCGSLPQASKLKVLSPISPKTSDAANPSNQGVTSDRRRQSLNLNTIPFSSITNPRQSLDPKTVSESEDSNGKESLTENCRPNLDKDFQEAVSSQKSRRASKVPEDIMAEVGKAPGTEKAPKPKKEHNMDKESKKDKKPEMEPSTGHVVFSKVPTREEVLEDAVMFLSVDEEESVAKSQTRASQGSHSLAARLRKQRKRLARKRSELLDKEPLVQYYRSVRGTLEPLLTEPSRKSFPFPSGRPQYEQNKLLREEHQKDIERRQDIDTFFNDLFQKKQTGQTPKPPDTNKGASPTKNNQMDQLLKMRRQSRQLANSVKRNSIQQLSTCQYLRVYDWDANRKKNREREPVMTSWGTAENRLKAGFLAMNFTD